MKIDGVTSVLKECSTKIKQALQAVRKVRL